MSRREVTREDDRVGGRGWGPVHWHASILSPRSRLRKAASSSRIRALALVVHLSIMSCPNPKSIISDANCNLSYQYDSYLSHSSITLLIDTVLSCTYSRSIVCNCFFFFYPSRREHLPRRLDRIFQLLSARPELHHAHTTRLHSRDLTRGRSIRSLPKFINMSSSQCTFAHNHIAHRGLKTGRSAIA